MEIRRLLWSVRRELWENRSLWVAPLAVGALIIAAYALTVHHWADFLHAEMLRKGRTELFVTFLPFGLASSAIVALSWVLAAFYAIEALHGERRDRSIVFWKSMPVSDVTTVVAKAGVALVVVPAIAVAISLATQVVMAIATYALSLARGVDALPVIGTVPWSVTTIAMIYGVVVQALWFAPVAGYLLLVSAWARRLPSMWALLPIFAAVVVEGIAWRSWHVLRFLGDRIFGARRAYTVDVLNEPVTQLSQLDPARFFSSPGLWLGLVVACFFIAAAVQVRRRADAL